jgi:hypothetical protein
VYPQRPKDRILTLVVFFPSLLEERAQEKYDFYCDGRLKGPPAKAVLVGALCYKLVFHHTT